MRGAHAGCALHKFYTTLDFQCENADLPARRNGYVYVAGLGSQVFC